MSSQTDILLNMPGPGAAEPIIALPEPLASTPSSQIDPTVPVYANPTTQSVRDNFATAKAEITALMQQIQTLPFMPLSGGKFTGPVYLYNDPTDVMMPVTLGYFNANGGGGGTGGGGIPEAPSGTGFVYARGSGAWVPTLPLSGGNASQMTGELWLAGNPTDPLGAVPKQYADAIATTANNAVPLAGNATNPMTGLLVLSGDPTAPLGATTKQYTDAADNLRAPINNPTFTGVVNTAGRIIATAPSGPSLTLYDTTANRPTFGVYNNGGYFSVGLMTPTTGNPNGNPFATMDQSGNWIFPVRLTTNRAIVASGSGGAVLTLNDTTQSNIYCLWNGGHNLNIGIADANGVPQTQIAFVDPNGSWTMRNLTTGNVNTSQNVNVGGNLGVTGTTYTQAISAAGAIQSSSMCGAYNNATFMDNHGVIYTNQYGGFSIGYGWYGNIATYIGGTWVGNLLLDTSDRRLKSNITAPTVDALATIKQIPLHQFDLLPPGPDTISQHWDIGFTTDELMELIPLAVVEGPYNSVRMLPLLAYVVAALQQVLARVEALEGTRH